MNDILKKSVSRKKDVRHEKNQAKLLTFPEPAEELYLKLDQVGWQGTAKELEKERGDVKQSNRGGGPGLVVMGGDFCSEGCRFESQHRKLDGHFYMYLL